MHRTDFFRPSACLRESCGGVTLSHRPPSSTLAGCRRHHMHGSQQVRKVYQSSLNHNPCTNRILRVHQDTWSYVRDDAATTCGCERICKQASIPVAMLPPKELFGRGAAATVRDLT